MEFLNRKSYQKKTPFRDAKKLYILCEGEKREYDYFQYFRGFTSKIEIIPIKQTGGLSPKEMAPIIDKIVKTESTKFVKELDQIWLVFDIDRWGTQITDLFKAMRNRQFCQISISNPCFEVWLYFHLADTISDELLNGHDCSIWKNCIPKIIPGGFNSQNHPGLIAEAIANSQKFYSGTGYLPDYGSTQVHRLGKIIFDEIEEF